MTDAYPPFRLDMGDRGQPLDTTAPDSVGPKPAAGLS
jgi:hypothetical protein